MPANSLSLIRIVDDDAEMRESLEFLLSTEGWKSRSYASAEAFLETDDVMVPGLIFGQGRDTLTKDYTERKRNVIL